MLSNSRLMICFYIRNRERMFLTSPRGDGLKLPCIRFTLNVKKCPDWGSLNIWTISGVGCWSQPLKRCLIVKSLCVKDVLCFSCRNRLDHITSFICCFSVCGLYCHKVYQRVFSFLLCKCRNVNIQIIQLSFQCCHIIQNDFSPGC